MKQHLAQLGHMRGRFATHTETLVYTTSKQTPQGFA